MLVFSKVAKLLGGRVRRMITASAPISKDVLEMMKIAFSCPVMEAYGLSETSGAVTVTHRMWNAQSCTFRSIKSISAVETPIVSLMTW